MTGKQFKQTRKALGLNQATIGPKLGVHSITISRWERGIVPINRAAAALVRVWAANANRGKQKRSKAEMKAPNEGNSYADEEIVCILSDAPTNANSIKWAVLLGRSRQAIKMIYKKAAWSPRDREKVREEADASIMQIKRCKKLAGWIVGADVYDDDSKEAD